MKKYELGIVTAHPLVYIWKQAKTIFRTWMHARKNGLPANKWYGVYESGSEIVAVQVGCLPGAEKRAATIAKAMNDDEIRKNIW